MSATTTTTTAAADLADMNIISEGAAKIWVPKGNQVFYNNVQNVNRDLSVLVLNSFSRQHFAEERIREEGRVLSRPGWRKSLATWTSWGEDDINKDVEAHSKAVGESTRLQNERALANGSKIAPPDTTRQQQQPEPSPEDPSLRILEALAASGLRSIRYAKEIEGPKLITANDLEPSAAESILRNSQLNQPYPPNTRLIATHGDAVDVMTANRPGTGGAIAKSTRLGFHVVDLDPYGTPAPFLDSAVQAVTDGGLMCITATDLAVLSGLNPETCMGKYGSVPLNRSYGHEMAIRILLSSIDSHANRHGRYIVPLLSLKIDFYVRVFVRVYESQSEVKRASMRKSYVYQSAMCDTFRLVPLVDAPKAHSAAFSAGRFSLPGTCPETGSNWVVGGPIWSDPIHNFAFVKDLVQRLNNHDPSLMELKYGERVKGMLGAVLQELPDVPLYYSCESMGKVLHCSQPPLEKLQAALVHGGYRVSQAHHDPNVLKTDAPSEVIWDVYRCWIQKHPIAPNRMQDTDSALFKILQKPPQFKANFDPPPSVRAARRRVRTSTDGTGHANRKPMAASSSSSAADAAASEPVANAKWAHNPEANWGPKKRASSHREPQQEKRARDGEQQEEKREGV